MEISVAISYFHRKIGPIVFYSYPEMMLSKIEKARLADIMDQAFEEGFFTHKFGDLYSMNYYFEIPSDWARGNKEMLMLSVISTKTPEPEMEQTINSWCEDLANRLKMEHDIYKAFYEPQEVAVSDQVEQEIYKFRRNLEIWIKELYWLSVEVLREHSEEEKWAEIMSQPAIFKVIQKLSKGPMKKEILVKWFKTLFPEMDINQVLSKLEQERFVFINKIGHETFVLLVKEITITRVPPNCVIDMEEDNPELNDLTQIYIGEVAQFFENYKPTPTDGFQLFQLFANPKVYNVISQLREGPLSKDKVFSIVSEEKRNDLQRILDILEEKEVIDKFYYSGEQLYLLKTDIVMKASFPEYLKKLIPEKSEGYVAQSLSKSRDDRIEELQKEHLTEERTSIAEYNSKTPEISSIEHTQHHSLGEYEDKIEDGENEIFQLTAEEILQVENKPSFSISNIANSEDNRYGSDSAPGQQELNDSEIFPKTEQSSYIYSLHGEEPLDPNEQKKISEEFKRLLEVWETSDQDKKS